MLSFGDGGAEAVGLVDLLWGGCRNRGTFETCCEDVDVAALALESAERDEERFGTQERPVAFVDLRSDDHVDHAGLVLQQ